MQQKELLGVGAVVVGGLIVFVATQKKTSTSYSTDAGAVSSQANILAANSTAQTTQASEQLGLAKLAYGYATTHDANQTAEQLGLAQLSYGLAATHDSNQTKLLQQWQAGATTTQLAAIAANSTYQSALLDTASRFEEAISTAQTSQYKDYVTGQAALATSAATVADVTTQAGAATAIAKIQGQTAQAVAASQSAATVAVGQAQAAAATTISANQTTAEVNAANQAASASKSNGFWGALGSIGGALAGALIPNGASGSDTGGSIDSSTLPTYSAGIVDTTPTFTNFGLPSLDPTQLSGGNSLRRAA